VLLTSTEFISITKQNYLLEYEELHKIMHFYTEKIVQPITKHFLPVEC